MSFAVEGGGEGERQQAYAAHRRRWRRALVRWMAGGRLGFLRLKAADDAPLRPSPAKVGGQRDGCRAPGACESASPDLCRSCAAIVSASRRAA